MRYNPIPETDEDLADYRGSIVNLDPGTEYEIELRLEGTDVRQRFTARTWSEEFPIGKTIALPEVSHEKLVIEESGSPDGYVLYAPAPGKTATIDGRNAVDHCIDINASHVIIRGLTLKEPQSHAVVILNGHDIVIEECDISGWGLPDAEQPDLWGKNMEAALFAREADRENPTIERIVLQRCRIHHPRHDTNAWYEWRKNLDPERKARSWHTGGPQAVTMYNTKGNHVIRYNECWSDLEHMYNDIIGGGSNGSFRGAPGPDSDIYGNVVSHCWDDGLEVEGGNRNNRVWGNYITKCMMMMANAATSIGPLYIWRNVASIAMPFRESGGGLHFLKMGYAGGEHWMTGHMYIFHNTVFGPEQSLPTGGLGGNRIVKHTVSRNNILYVHSADGYSLSEHDHNIDNDYDYDLFNGKIPEGHETHGIRGVPVYRPGSGFDPATKAGSFHLADDSPGAGAGVPIPNFTDGFTGDAPDVGAHQRGAPPMRFGVDAGRP